MSGRLERIWIKRSHGGVMDEADTAMLDEGIVGDANHKGTRQVTLLDAGRWERVNQELGLDVDPIKRRANLLLSGVPLADSRGRILRIGDTRLEIRGETRPCNLMDEMQPGLRMALDADWGGGAHARVLTGGPIRVGDAVTWESSAESAELAETRDSR